MMKNKKPILFDLNGTLVNQTRTESSHITCAYAVLVEYRPEISYSIFEDAWRNSLRCYTIGSEKGLELLRAGKFEASKEFFREKWYRENVAATLATLCVSPSEDLIQAITEAFQESWCDGLSMPEEHSMVLEELSVAGHPLAVVTNFQQPDLIPNILARFGLSKFFRTVVISAEYGFRKPHPYIFWNALAKLNAYGYSENAIYVGDNPSDDVDGATFAGLQPILVDTKGKHERSGNRIIRIRSLTELPEILEGGFFDDSHSFILSGVLQRQSFHKECVP